MKKKRIIFLSLIFLLIPFIAGCDKCFFVKKTDIFATVDGDCITKKYFLLKTHLYNINIKSKKEAKEFLNLLINNYLILKEAKRDRIRFDKGELRLAIENFVPGYSSKEIKKVLKKANIKYSDWMNDIKEKLIIKKEINNVMKKKIKVKDEELKDYFWSNIIHFRRVYKVRARQIVVDTEEKAKKIMEKIKEGKDFSELAKKYSKSVEAKKGGDLGYFGKKDMPAFIVDTVFNLKKGQISGIIKSPYGYHIFKCEDIRYAKTPKFEEVKEEVYKKYFEEKKDIYFEKWMRTLRKKYKIKIFDKNIEDYLKKEVNNE